MSQYINLDDPEVEYYLNFGHSEVYIVKPEAERIDLVRCKDCIHYMEINQPYPQMYCKKHNLDPRGDDYCSYGERRTDEID